MTSQKQQYGPGVNMEMNLPTIRISPWQITLVLLTLIAISCNNKSATEAYYKVGSNDRQPATSGLHIMNGPTRGQGLIDSTGKKFGLVHIKTTISNKSKDPIDLQINFAPTYDYPEEYGKEQFELLVLPYEFTLDRIEIPENIMQVVLNRNFDNSLDRTLEPGDTCVLSIGIIRPSRPGLCSATPYALLDLLNEDLITDCDQVRYNDSLQVNELNLGVKVGFCTVGGDYESCSFIRCGLASISKQ